MPFSNILLIDDDYEDHEIFYAAVQSISSTVVYSYCDDAEKALQKLSSGELLPQVIFLDLNMPTMRGEEFLTHIKKLDKLSQIPVIIFSTSSNPSTKQSVVALGAYDFITKPADFSQLINLLKPFVG